MKDRQEVRGKQKNLTRIIKILSPKKKWKRESERKSESLWTITSRNFTIVGDGIQCVTIVRNKNEMNQTRMRVKGKNKERERKNKENKKQELKRKATMRITREKETNKNLFFFLAKRRRKNHKFGRE